MGIERTFKPKPKTDNNRHKYLLTSLTNLEVGSSY